MADGSRTLHPDHRRSAMLFIGLPWIIFHYITKWKAQATLTTEDEKLLDELHELARRLDDRMRTIERIIEAENPDWRGLGQRSGRGPARGPHRPALRSRRAQQPPGARPEELMNSPRTKFYLDKQNAKWSGVCAGIADYTGIDVTLVRLGFVLGTVFIGGSLALARLLASSPGWRRTSRPSSTRRPARTRSSGRACAPIRSRIARDVRSRFRELDRRLADVETYVTSSNHRLAREIERLR